MKKLYSFILLALFAAIGLTVKASPYSINIFIEDESYIDAMEAFYLDENWDQVFVDLNVGDNVLTFDSDDQTVLYLRSMANFYGVGDLIFGSVSGYAPESSEEVDLTSTFAAFNWDELEPIMVPFYDIEGYEDDWDSVPEVMLNGWKVVPHMISIDALRSASATVKLDVANAAVINVSGTWRQIDLPEEENIVKFEPDNEYEWTIGSNYDVSGMPLYKVIWNGEEMTDDGYGFYLDFVQDGDVIEIISQYPDIDCNVSISFTEGSENAVSAAKVFPIGVWDEDEALDFDVANGGTVKLGSTFTLYFNDDYNVKSVTYNGEEVEMYPGDTYANAQIRDEEVEFVVDAALWQFIDLKVNVNDPSAVSIRAEKGYYFSLNEPLEVEDGVTLNVKENCPCIIVTPRPGYSFDVIEGVTSDGDTVDFNKYYTGEYYLDIVENDVVEINIVCTPISRDNVLVVYVDNIDIEGYSMYIRSSNNEYYLGSSGYQTQQVVAGYQTIEFDGGDNPFDVQSYCSTAAVYLNNEWLEDFENDKWLGRASGVINAKHNDVLKIYNNGKPEEYDLTFSIDGVDAQVIADKVVEVVPAEGLHCLAQTEIQIIPESSCVVTVDGVAVEAVDGKYVVVVSDNHNISVAEPTQSIVLGDVNGDGEVSVNDIVYVVNAILGNPADDYVAEAADVNGDGDVSVADAVLIANMILFAQ